MYNVKITIETIHIYFKYIYTLLKSDLKKGSYFFFFCKFHKTTKYGRNEHYKIEVNCKN